MSIPIALLTGIVAGTAATAAVVVWLMRTRMLVAHRSRRSFEETCAAIETVVLSHKGWGFPIETWNFYETFRKKDLVPDNVRKIRVFFVCNAALASRVISADPSIAGMMPCSWAVYELEDGSVWVSKMNIGMMARMFAGVIGDTMKTVAEADEIFLRPVLGEEDLNLEVLETSRSPVDPETEQEKEAS